MNERDLDNLASAGTNLIKAGCGMLVAVMIVIPVLLFGILILLSAAGVLD